MLESQEKQHCHNTRITIIVIELATAAFLYKKNRNFSDTNLLLPESGDFRCHQSSPFRGPPKVVSFLYVPVKRRNSENRLCMKQIRKHNIA